MSDSPFRRVCLRSVTAILLLATSLRAEPPLTLWYQQPAKQCMTEALPIGNGRLGAMIFGIPEAERIVLNEDSLWTGDADPSGAYDEHFGAYQELAELELALTPAGEVEHYRRDLDLATATAHVEYDAGGIHYRRECFVSHPAQVIVVRLTADHPHAYKGTISLTDKHGAAVTAAGATLIAAGTLANGLAYETQLQAIPDGGTATAESGSLSLGDCDAVTLLIAAHTDYAMNPAAGFRGSPPHGRVAAELAAAAATPFAQLKADHLKDFRSLFDRVSLNLGSSTAEQRALPTDLRKVAASKVADPELEALLFQWGRYLLISSSRPGSLPANLQGIWNDSNTPPWHSDYHANINIEMNYWPAEVTNLAECHTPLFDLLQSQLPLWRKATAETAEFAVPGKPAIRGFAVRTSHNIFGGLGWKWDKTANAWYCQHLWEHYAFSGDKAFLRETAYPILKETCEFWQDHLKKLPDGRLVVPRAWSPEHGPTQDGVSYAQEIVWDLFTNTIDACNALDTDPQFRDTLIDMRDHLAVPRVGSWGQLLEWMTELHDPKSPELDTPNDHHRHTSHLFGLFPGRQISLEKTPKLTAAARVSLTARGNTGDVREWSFAWRTALWARLGDGDLAETQLMQLFSNRNTCPNLFGLHPPMQIDGDFGATAAIAEMLLQSQDGNIHVLPAIPSNWATGSVTGLRARGGFTVDITWEKGSLASASVHGRAGTTLHLRNGDRTVDATLPASGTLHVDQTLATRD